MLPINSLLLRLTERLIQDKSIEGIPGGPPIGRGERPAKPGGTPLEGPGQPTSERNFNLPIIGRQPRSERGGSPHLLTTEPVNTFEQAYNLLSSEGRADFDARLREAGRDAVKVMALRSSLIKSYQLEQDAVEKAKGERRRAK